MLLADALFEHVASTLGGEAAAPAPSVPAAEQRRRENRVGVQARVTVIPLSDGLQIAPFEAPLRDLSAGGIGFVNSRKMSLDDPFVVLLPTSGESVAVLCEVAHYQPLAEDAFAVGGRFVRVLGQPGAANDGSVKTGHPVRMPAPVRAAS
jgi:hypothetical protein